MDKKENLVFEGKLRLQLESILETDLKYNKYNDIRPDKAKFGYKEVVLLLGITALFAVLTLFGLTGAVLQVVFTFTK